jgi:CRISPR/Cas system-associated exonuclease Cas4 (RecB family)
MTLLDIKTTLDYLDDAMMERENSKSHRQYIGMGQIGEECERKLWYSFNKYPRIPFEAKTLRMFEDGHRTEALMAERLRMLPFIELHTDVNGEQYGFRDFDTLFSGKMDGAIRGLIEAPQTWHVWECKATNDKAFKEFKALTFADEKSALEKWNYTYYAQAVLYMEYSGMTRHYITVTTAGGRDYHGARTNENPKLAKALRQKAKRIIDAKSEPARLNENPSFYKCKWCEFRGVCHAV